VTSPERLPRRLAAVWFGDIVGYTRLAAEDENAALAAVRRFQKVVRDVTEPHQGRLVKLMGDAALVEFPSAQGAVTAGLALIEALGHRLSGEGHGPVVARVGIHVGEVVSTPEGDLLGDDVNLASRIHTAAEPGQVVVSDSVARQLRHHREIIFEPLGERELKGVPEMTRVFVARRASEDRPRHAATAPPRSIAVLPFVNLSPDPDNEYFSDGVMEEILTALAQIEGLKVISRTSAMRYKGTDRSVRQIGEELGVATILEGSVRRASDRVRITAQLIDARTDEHLWASRYDRDLEDIFAIQTDVAERIVEALKGRLTPVERARLAETPTRDVDAYQHYLRGVHFWNRRERTALARAAAEFESAIELDPTFAQAWTGLAGVHALKTDWDPSAARESLRRATEATERALELDPASGIAHAVLGQIFMRKWKWEKADLHSRRGVELAPGDATARQWRAHYLSSVGRLEEAFPEIEKALELDPLSLPVQTQAALVMVLARRFDEAERRLHYALELDPRFLPAAGMLANLHHHLGRHAEAHAQWRNAALLVLPEVELAPDAGLEELIASARDAGAPPGYIAIMCAVVGHVEEAFQFVEQGLEVRDVVVVTFAMQPFLDPLREDPRFAEVLEEMGLRKVAGVAR
jgi:TolB-like protein/Tfp pilus assembly protein PilF